jgi:uncharacterized protein (DUF488 family)
MPRALATIGYEHALLNDVIERLKRAGVQIVLDVRAVASSRRAGFSKTLLAASLNEAGIDYLHLRGLGTPKPGRQAARAGHTDDMHRIYHEHLKEPQAQLELAQAADIARTRTAALLCYEANVKDCHRAIVADLIREKIGCEVTDL